MTTIEARATFFETSKLKINWNPFDMDCGSLFLKCKIARPKTIPDVTKRAPESGPVSYVSICFPEMPNRSSSLTAVKFATIRDGNTTGIRLKITIDMVKKNTIQEIGPGLIFSVLCGSGTFSGIFACFSCFFINFLAKLRLFFGLKLKTQAVEKLGFYPPNRLFYIFLYVFLVEI